MKQSDRVKNNEHRDISQIFNKESFKTKQKSADSEYHFIVPWELFNDKDNTSNTKSNDKV